MSFLGGYKWETNPGLDEATGALQGAYDEAGNFKSRGSKFANSFLKGLQNGDTSAIGNPFQAGAAADKRNIDTNLDPFLPPELAAAQGRLAKARVDEQTGVNFENYVHGMAGDAMNLSERKQEFKQGQRSALAQAIAEAQLGGHTGHQTQGWGGLLMQGLIGGASAASGLGWKPFGTP